MPQYIDLSHTFCEGMQSHPSQPPVEFTQTARIFMEHFHATRVSFGSHCGSHVDSPSHMFDGAHPLVDEIPLETLIGPAKIAKFRKEQKETVTKADILAACGELEQGDRLVVSFGWYPHWRSRKYFDNYPTFTMDAVEYMVEKKIALLAMDTPSPDRPDYSWGEAKRTENHHALMKGNVIIVESLTNLESIPDGKPFELIVLPLRAKGLDGFPVRAVAVCR